MNDNKNGITIMKLRDYNEESDVRRITFSIIFSNSSI